MGNIRIAIVGAGGVGGYLGAALAKSGTWVALVARGEHLEAIRRGGLHVDTPEGAFVVSPASVTSDPIEIGPVDVIIAAVKAWQMGEIAGPILPLLGRSSRVLPIQNGVEASSILRQTIPRELVLDGVCRIVSEMIGPGRIRHVGVQPTVHFGEADGGELSPASLALRDALSAAGIVVHAPADMRLALWEKLHFLAPLSAVASVARVPVGEIRRNPATRSLVLSAMREVVSVAEAAGVRLPEEAVARSVEMFDNVPDQTTVSLQRDIAAGRPSELDAIVGVVARLGAKHSVQTPVMETLHAALLPLEARARGMCMTHTGSEEN